MDNVTSETLILEVPFPPSVNGYWGFQGSRRFLTNKAKEFKANCSAAFIDSHHQGFGTNRLKVRIELYMPDRRIRDVDNYAKSLLDALCQANVFEDDGQIDELTLVRKQLFKGGKTVIHIQSMPCQQSITQA